LIENISLAVYFAHRSQSQKMHTTATSEGPLPKKMWLTTKNQSSELVYVCDTGNSMQERN